MEVLDCLVEVSISGTFYWVRIFKNNVDVIGIGHNIIGCLDFHPYDVFHKKQGLLIRIEIVDAKYTYVSFNIFILNSY